jgi:branched-chain amino acid transport system substrate-binding protein
VCKYSQYLIFLLIFFYSEYIIRFNIEISIGGRKMSKVKKLVSFMLVIALVIVSFAGCGSSKETSKEEASVIKLGSSLPRTGPVAVYGTAVEKGVNLAIDKYNKDGGVLGKQVEFIVYDNKADSTEAVNAYNKLVNNDGVDAIVGAVISTNSLAIGPLAAKDGIPMVTPTSTNWDVTLAGENVFRSCYTDPYQGGIVAKFASEDLNAKKAAVMYDTANDYAVGLAKAFKESFEKSGGEVVSYEGFVAADKDYKSVLTNIKNQDPDVLFIPDYYNTVALIGKQVKEVGLEATLLGGDGWDGILGVDASAVEGGYFASHYATDDPDPMIQDFIKAYKEANDGEMPNSFVALGYDAAILVMEAMKAAGTTDHEKVIEALKNTDLDLVTGHSKFDENRNPIKEVSIIQVVDGQYKLSTKK